MFIFAIISYLIAKLFANGAVKGTDRLLGIGFGVLRAAAIIVAFIIIGRGLGLSANDWWANSNYLKHFEPTASFIEELLPEEWRNDDAEEETETIKDKIIDGVIKGQLSEPAQ